MAGNSQGGGIGDDFFEQMLGVNPGAFTSGIASHELGSLPMVLQLGSGGGGAGGGGGGGGGGGDDGGSVGGGGGGGLRGIGLMPLGLNLEQSGLLGQEDSVRRYRDDIVDGNASNASSTTSAITMERESVHNMTNLFPAFGQLQPHSIRPAPTQPPPRAPPQIHQPFHSQQTGSSISSGLNPPAMRPRVRARRGQATDPHSIAERLRRERIAERMKALQELVPSCNKTDRAAMLDEIVDYVKFLRLQVKVLSMSRLGGAGAVAQLVADVPIPSSVEGEGIDGGNNQPAWEKWSTDGTEQQVAKLMEEDVGAAMQFLQSKALCIMPISLASAIFQTNQPDASRHIKPESNNPP